MSREMVVDSPPGIASALHRARSAGLLTSKTSVVPLIFTRSSARQKASICSLTLPWSASTPILTSTGLQHLIVPEGVHVKSRHGIPETFAYPGNYLCIIEVIDRFHNCLGHPFGT